MNSIIKKWLKNRDLKQNSAFFHLFFSSSLQHTIHNPTSKDLICHFKKKTNRVQFCLEKAVYVSDTRYIKSTQIFQAVLSPVEPLHTLVHNFVHFSHSLRSHAQLAVFALNIFFLTFSIRKICGTTLTY